MNHTMTNLTSMSLKGFFDLVLGAAIVVAVLAFLFVKAYEKRVKKKSAPQSVAQHFNKKFWPSTAKQIGLIASYNQKLPKVSFSHGEAEPDEGTFDNVTIYPEKGEATRNYMRFCENFKTMFDAERVDCAEVKNTAQYTIWYELPHEKNSALNLPVIPWKESECLARVEEPFKSPIGVDASSRKVYVDVQRHVLVLGGSGSGKSTLLWDVVGGQLENELQEFWGIDLKNMEEYSKNPDLFTELGGDAQGVVRVIMKLDAIREDRGVRKSKGFPNKKSEEDYNRDGSFTPRLGTDGVTFSAADKFIPTPDERCITLFVDEMNNIPEIIEELQADKSTRDEGMKLKRAWRKILREGRSVGIRIYGAAQDPSNRELQDRGLFTQRICMKQNDSGLQEIAMKGSSRFYETWKWDEKADAGKGLMYDTDGNIVLFKSFLPTGNQIAGWVKK